MTALARVLVVGMEPDVLDGWLQASPLTVEAVTGPEAGLARIRDAGPYAVVLADLHMRPMGGAEFIVAARRLSPNTSRVLLADPTDPAELMSALDAALEHYRLMTAERDLLERTLGGTVRALIEVLALTSPAEFARATRLRELATAVIRASGAEVCWHHEVAAMLAQVSAIAIPADVLHRADRVDDLDVDERAMVAALPDIADRMLADIPRIEQVREAILSQNARYDGQNPADPRVGHAIPLGGRALRVARDFGALTAAGAEPHAALWTMRTSHGSYDPKLIDALATVLADRAKRRVQDVDVADLLVGMVLAEDVSTVDGRTVVGSGHELTIGALERIRGFARVPPGVQEPARVYRTSRPRSTHVPLNGHLHGEWSATSDHSHDK